MDGRTDRRTDGQTDAQISHVFNRTLCPLGPLPKKVTKFISCFCLKWIFNLCVQSVCVQSVSRPFSRFFRTSATNNCCFNLCHCAVQCKDAHCTVVWGARSSFSVLSHCVNQIVIASRTEINGRKGMTNYVFPEIQFSMRLFLPPSLSFS